MRRELGANPFGAFLLLLMGGGLCVAALLVSQLETNMAILIGVGIAIAVLVFLKTKIAIYLLIFSMLLSPEFGVGGLATTGGTLGRGVTFRLDDFLLVIIAASWLIKSALYKELGIFKKTPLNGAMLFYAFACFLSTLIGIAAGRVEVMTGSLFVLKYIQYFVLFFLIINHIEDEKQVRRYWLAVLVVALIVAAIGLTQIPGGGRVTAPFEGASPEPNTLGGYLAFLILICFALFLNLSDYRRRISYLFDYFFSLCAFLVYSLASFLSRFYSRVGCGAAPESPAGSQLHPGSLVPDDPDFSQCLPSSYSRPGRLHLYSRTHSWPGNPLWSATGYVNLCSTAKFPNGY